MKKIGVILITTLSVIVIFFAVFLVYATIWEWRPKEVENVAYTSTLPRPLTSDTISIISWNLGYGGLGAEMDFFMDGGNQSVATRENTIKNIENIKQFLRENSNIDFFLLQEVDSFSKRNYDINLYGEIVQSLPYFTPYFALNYSSPYVPIPLSDPIGRVNSGLLTLSKTPAFEAKRVSFPQYKSYPVRLFHLKRAFLQTKFKSKNGGVIDIINTHNSAFDNGDSRRGEMNFLASELSKLSSFVVAGDWNAAPPLYRLSKQESEDKYFSPIVVDSLEFGKGVNFAVDYNGKSSRYNNMPYNKNLSTTTLIDFGIYSSNIKCLDVEIIDLGFENSDHNPVYFQFTIR
ncbi:MAG: hypothetical protein R3Y50_01595 [Rikenellaceae bacterium]